MDVETIEEILKHTMYRIEKSPAASYYVPNIKIRQILSNFTNLHVLLLEVSTSSSLRTHVTTREKNMARDNENRF